MQAAERRKNVAPGASPGKEFIKRFERRRCGRSCRNLSPLWGSHTFGRTSHGSRRGLHYAAAPRLGLDHDVEVFNNPANIRRTTHETLDTVITMHGHFDSNDSG